MLYDSNDKDRDRVVVNRSSFHPLTLLINVIVTSSKLHVYINCREG